MIVHIVRHREFQRGNFTLEDAEREGKLQTSVAEGNITAVKKMLGEDIPAGRGDFTPSCTSNSFDSA
ncbi:hypothetical protein ILUMI_17225 [Ignelater luminosus]|uniref:Uncharacterized protein n=1 Tax=Ignelater luminosus TaxID=2038154 RepID=A0A8K0CQV1_IGNLU|nr:hypothetical protein ILUMI_17225 [Ignelater luminosus]